MKTAISLPDEVFRAVEVHAKRLRLSRSEFFVRAAKRLLSDLESERLTASYDEAFADKRSSEDLLQERANRRALLDVEWKDE